MPAYNSAKYIDQAIDSILNQTYADFELIIVNDGSTDKTPAIAADFAKRDHRIRIITNQQNLGITKTGNIGPAEAKGEFIANHDADDFSEPDRFAKQVETLQAHSEIDLLGCNHFLLSADGSRRKKSAMFEFPTFADLQRQNHFIHSTVMMRKAVVDEVGGYDEFFTVSHDYELWLRIAKGSKTANLPNYLVTYRAHAESVSQQNFKQQEAMAMYAVQMHSGRVTAETHAAIAKSGGGAGNLAPSFASRRPIAISPMPRWCMQTP